jgi:hypothetical protein
MSPGLRIVAQVIPSWEHVRQRRHVHPVHESDNLLWAHWHTSEGAEFEKCTHEYHPQPFGKRHTASTLVGRAVDTVQVRARQWLREGAVWWRCAGRCE